jgi:hypothetical protein
MDKSFFKSIGGLALSLGVVFATVWVASKAWNKGQEKKTF